MCLAELFFLFLLVICSQLSSSRSLVLCADGGTSSSQPVSSYASLISPLSQTLLPFSFFALRRPPHLLPSPFSIVLLSFLGLFFPCFVVPPLAVPYSPAAPCVCDCLPSAGHPLGLANMCFCSCCVNPEGTFWVQKLLFACHSVCMSYHLERRPPTRAEGEWERDFEAVSSLSIV